VNEKGKVGMAWILRFDEAASAHIRGVVEVDTPNIAAGKASVLRSGIELDFNLLF
jgi:hypothetical protein